MSSDACPDSVEKIECSPLNQNDEWLQEPTRTATFQAFLDSLEERSVRRARLQPTRPVFGNYATKR